MTFLFDTNVWIFGANSPEVLPDEIQEILASRHERFAISAISLWEVGKKHQIGKLNLQMELSAWLRGATAMNIDVLPLSAEIVTDTMSLPDFPVNDSADEIIVATARIHRLTLLTTDTKLKNYRHARIRHFTPLVEKSGKHRK